MGKSAMRFTLCSMHMTSWQPYCCCEKWNVCHVDVPNQSCGSSTLFYVNTFICSNKFAWLLETWVNTLNVKHQPVPRQGRTTTLWKTCPTLFVVLSLAFNLSKLRITFLYSFLAIYWKGISRGILSYFGHAQNYL